jgi:hypothetical protein
VQHGHHLYGDDTLVVFSNGSFQGGQAHALHYTLSGTTATLDWQYTDMGNSSTLGDIQALPNGNFLITQSQGGNIDEIDENQMLVQRINVQTAGYVNHRPSLYGPPPQ